MVKFEISNLTLAVLVDPLVSLSRVSLLWAAIADYVIGDPWGWLHPVQVMGWVIQRCTNIIIEICNPGWQRRIAGSLLGLFLIMGSGLWGWLLIWGGSMIHPLLGKMLEVVLLASCFAGKSLRLAVKDVLESLATEDIIVARSRLAMYVGRDTDDLSQPEILRALLETVAENTVDGVTAPLFYAIVGSFTPMGVVPLTLAYKAASTLDSMIGYLKEPYTDIGWFSAQLEDRLTWIPCRLTVLTLSFFSGNPLYTWSICFRDGKKDPSPNSGWSEAAYAAILGVQLGGTNTYKGIIKEKPLLGDAINTISIPTINRALMLTRSIFLLWLAIAIFMNAIILYA